MSTVGFIGLGTMGRPMARNLLKAGHQLVFFARRPEIAEEFSAAGASRAQSAADVARAAEFIITIVTADADVRQVALGRGGLIEGAAAGKILIDMSTIGPDTTREVGAKLALAGMTMLDAPVSGGPMGAESGKLTIMVGGQEAAYQRCRDVLGAMGTNLFYLGPLGAGQTVKLINQMVGGGIMALACEGLVLARAAGVDPGQVAEVMAVSSAASAAMASRGKKFILADDFTPHFMTCLMHKDMALAVDLAQQLKVPTPLGAAALHQYTAALNLGCGESDFSSVAKVCEQAAGVRIVAPPAK